MTKNIFYPARVLSFLILLAVIGGSTLNGQTYNPKVTANLTGTHCIGSLLTAGYAGGTPLLQVWKNAGVTQRIDYATWASNANTVAGKTASSGSADSLLNYPSGIFVDSIGNIYIADSGNNRVQKWTPGAKKGITVAGDSTGTSGSASNQLSYPIGVYVDKNGNVYVADAGNNRVQKWAPGAVKGTTVAGDSSGISGSAGNLLSQPTGVFVDDSGNVYVSDAYNNRVQKWAPGATTGITVAGGHGSGPGSNQLIFPAGLYVDANGTVYVADAGNNRVQKWTAGASTGSTVAGGHGKGNASNQLNYPSGVFVDGLGNIYVADQNNQRIQQWLSGATKGYTVAGDSAGNNGSGASKLSYPRGVFLDGGGNIYVGDAANHRVQEFMVGIAHTFTPTSAGGVDLINTSFAGIIDTSNTIIVYSHPTASITSFNDTICNGNNSTVRFHVIAHGAWKLVLSSGDTATGIGNGNFSITVSPSVTKTYTLSSMSDSVCASISSDLNGVMRVIVRQRPTATITSSNVVFCPGDTASLNITGNVTANGAWTLKLNNSGGTATGTGNGTFSLPVMRTTGTIFKVFSLNDAYCTSISSDFTGSTVIAPTIRPTANITSANTSVCYGTSTIIAGSIKAHGSWTLTLNSGDAATGRDSGTFSITVYPSSSTAYQIASVTDSLCTARPSDLTGSTYVGIGNTPYAWITANNVNYCNGSSTSTAIKGFVYATGSWTLTLSDGSIATGRAGTDTFSITVSPSVTTIYTITSLVDSVCTAPSNYLFYSTTIAVDSSAISTISGSPCAGSPLTVTYRGNSPVYQAWKRGSVIVEADSTTGKTIAGGNGYGVASSQLSYPFGLMGDASGNIYIADAYINRVQKWAPGAARGKTVAGDSTGASGTDATHLYIPYGVCLDTGGNIYIADAYNNRIQKWAPGANKGITVAGDSSGSSGTTADKLNHPAGVFVDGSGNIYIADAANNRVQKWAPGATKGITVAGDSSGGFGSGSSSLYYPWAVSVDGSGNVFISDLYNLRVQKWAPGASSGSTVAGGHGYGTASNQLGYGYGMWVDGGDTVYVADAYNNRIQKWAPGAAKGITVVGDSLGGNLGSSSSQLSYPFGVYVDANRNIYVSDGYNYRVQKFNLHGIKNTYTPDTSGSYSLTTKTMAGCIATSNIITEYNRPKATITSSNVSYCNGMSTTTHITGSVIASGSWTLTLSDGSIASGTGNGAFNIIVSPTVTTTYSVTALVDAHCSATVTDFKDSTLVTIYPRPTATLTVSNTCGSSGSIVHLLCNVTATGPWSITLSPSGSASGTGSGLFNINVTPAISTTYTPATLHDARCSALSTDLSGSEAVILNGVTATLTGIPCLGDTLKATYNGGKPVVQYWQRNDTIVRTDYATWRTNATTIAGDSTTASGTTSSLLSAPKGSFTDRTGNVYVADYDNNRIQKWAPGVRRGITVAGDSSGISGHNSSTLSHPTGVFVDGSGNIYIADADNNRIQKWMTGAAKGSTVAGDSSGTSGSSSNRLNLPYDVFVDDSGNVYTSDANNNRIQKWAPGASKGITIAGDSSGSAGLAGNLLHHPLGIFVSAVGDLYIADANNNRIQKWTKGSTFGLTVAGDSAGTHGSTASLLYNPSAVYMDGSGDIFIADENNSRVQLWFAGAGTGVTIAGSSSGTHGSTNVLLNFPMGVYLDANNYVYVSDQLNNRVQKFTINTISHTYIPVISGTYKIQTQSFGGCAVISDAYNEYIHPTASITSINSTLCKGDMTNIAVSITARGNWKLKFNSGDSLNGNGSGIVTVPVNPILTTTYTLVSIIDSVCSSTAADLTGSVVITVINHRPKVIITSRDTAICNGTGVHITGTVTAVGAWGLTLTNSGGSAIGTGNGAFSILVNPLTATTYTVASLSDSLCSATPLDITGSTSVSVDSVVTAILTGKTCVGSTLYAAYNNGSGPSLQQWKRGNTIIRRDTAHSTISGATTVAGGHGFGTGNNQILPYDMTVDAKGNIYVADAYNNRVQKWAPGATKGITVAGDSAGVSGTASNLLHFPSSVAVDASGNVYVTDYYNSRVQKWAPGATKGITVAGDSNGVAGITADKLYYPLGVFVDGSGNIYVSDGDSRVQKWARGAISGITVAGGHGYGSANNQMAYPYGVCVDRANNIYIADASNNRIQKWAPGASNGITVAGDSLGSAGTSNKKLNFPIRVNLDANNNVYIADFYNNRIQKWAPGSKKGTTVAGDSSCSAGSSSTRLSLPIGVYANGNGYIYVADYNNLRVQKFTVKGINNSYTPTSSGKYFIVMTSAAGCTANSDTVNVYARPTAVITSTNTSVCDTANITGTVTATGTWTVGLSPSGSGSGYGNGSFSIPVGSLTNTKYNLGSLSDSVCYSIPADLSGSTIVSLTQRPSAVITSHDTSMCSGGAVKIKGTVTAHGSWTLTLSNSGGISTGHGNGAFSLTVYPVVTTVYTVASLVDSLCNSIAIDLTGTTTATINPPITPTLSGSPCIGSPIMATYTGTLAPKVQVWKRGIKIVRTDSTSLGGKTVAGGNGYGTADNQLGYPFGVCVDSKGNVYVDDAYNSRIQKWAPGATKGKTVAGQKNGIGGRLSTQLYYPFGVAVDASGNVYVADFYNNRVQKWAPGAKRGKTVAGDSTGIGGNANNQLSYPTGVAVDASGNVYVCDYYNSRIQKWAPGATHGVTVAGDSTGGYGTASNELYYPWSVCVDSHNNVYIGDLYNYRVQKWAPGASSGTTVAGGNGYGVASNQLSYIYGLTVDAGGNVFVADAYNNRVQRWAPGATKGVTVVGDSSGGGFGSSSTELEYPFGVAVDASGNIYVSDGYNYRVQKFNTYAINNTYIPDTSGSYTLTTTSAAGCKATSNAIIVYPRPSAIITSANVSYCKGSATTTHITGTVKAAGAWTLTLTDGSTATGADTGTFNITVSPAATTVYKIASLSDTVCSSTAQDFLDSTIVTINPRPSATINSPDIIVCLGSTTNIYGTIKASGPWAMTLKPAGTATGTGNGIFRIKVFPPADTTYKIFSLTDSLCSSLNTDLFDSTKVTLNTHLPKATVTSANTVVCNGTTVSITGNVIATGIWDLTLSDSGGTATGIGNGTFSIPVTTDTTTAFKVLTLVDSICASTIADLLDSTIVTIKPSPKATMTSIDTGICYGSSTNLTGNVTATGPWTLTLNNSGGTATGTGNGTFNVVVNPTITTNYKVVSMSDSICSSISTDLKGATNVAVGTHISVAISGNACVGSPITALYTGGTPVTQYWRNINTVVRTDIKRSTTTTVAGGNGAGSGANQVSAYSVFEDTSGNIYVADGSANRVQKWARGATSGTTVAGSSAGKSGKGNSQLWLPYDVFVDKHKNIYIADAFNNRVQKWTPGATRGKTVAGDSTGLYGSTASRLGSPTGIFVDDSSNVYVADQGNNRIEKWAPGAHSGTMVVGGHGLGAHANQLSYPAGIYVDAIGNIYIADYYNHRIQKWAPGASKGVTVAGDSTGATSSAANQLSYPTSVWLDRLGNIYVADAGNNRIQLWSPGATKGRTVAGDSTGASGSGIDQLNYPAGVYVDDSSNLFVADEGNNRVLKYSANTISHEYTPDSSGKYSLVILSATGCRDTSNNINEYNRPKAIITSSNTTICNGSSTTLHITGTVTATGAWTLTLNSGATATGRGNGTFTISISPTITTTYTVASLVDSVCSSKRIDLIDSTIITVNQRPLASITSLGSAVCAGTATLIKGTVNAKGNWRLKLSSGDTARGRGNGTFSISVSPTATTTYTIASLNDSLCTSKTADLTGSVIITINKRPTANIISTNKTYCNGNSTSTSIAGIVTATGPWTLNLSNGASGAGTGNGSFTITVMPTATTTYTVASLSDLVCASKTADLTGHTIVTVNPRPTARLSISSPGLCDGGTVTVSARVTASGNWKLYTSIDTISGRGSITKSVSFTVPATAHVYTIYSKALSDSVCSSNALDLTDTSTLTVSNAINISTSPLSLTTCPSNTIRLTTSAINAAGYQWQDSSSITSGTWVNLSNISPYTGVNNDTIVITAPSSSLNNTHYRCNISAHTGCIAKNTQAAILKVVNVSSGNWLGVTSTDWNDPTNWCGNVPTASTDVTISSTALYQPIINSTAYCHNLNIGTGATVTVSSGDSLKIAGNLSVLGSLRNPSGTLTLDGTSAQTIPPVSVYNLSINNAAGVKVTPAGSTLTVNNTLMLLNGVLTADTVSITNCAINAITGYNTDPTKSTYLNSSYINGVLKRCVNNVGQYDYPVGSYSNYELISFLHNSLLGVSNMKVKFDTSNSGCSIPNPDSLIVNGTQIHTLLNGGYWISKPDAEPSSGNYSVFVNERGYTAYPGSAAQMTIIKRDDCSAMWKAAGTHINSTQYFANNTAHAERSGISSFSNFGIGWGDEALPVGLVNFNAKAITSNLVHTSWTVLTQHDNVLFNVQRSVDGYRFNTIGSVDGCGTCSDARAYSLDDPHPVLGLAYYRLQLMDVHGAISYSRIATVNISQEGLSTFKLYPNPTTGDVRVSVNSKTTCGLTIKITDLLGHVVITQHIALNVGENNISVKTANLISGIYLIQAQTENQSYITRLIIQK